MIKQFGDWQLDLFLDQTQDYYKTLPTVSSPAVINEYLAPAQQDFLTSLGVDLSKIKFNSEVRDFGEGHSFFSLRFDVSLKGNLLGIPKWQAANYQDPEIYNLSLPNDLKVGSSDEMDFYQVAGLDFVFKHPQRLMDSSENFKWNCGEILLSGLMMGKNEE